MSDTQKQLLVRLSEVQAQLDSIKADIKESEKPKDKDNVQTK